MLRGSAGEWSRDNRASKLLEKQSQSSQLVRISESSLAIFGKVSTVVPGGGMEVDTGRKTNDNVQVAGKVYLQSRV